LTALDTVSLTAHTTYNSYDPGIAGIAFDDTLANATWKHRISPIATLIASSDAEFEHFDNALNTDITILRETGGFDATFSPLLSLRGMAGLAYVQTERGSPTFSILPVTGPVSNASISGSLTDFIGNLVLTYKMFPDTTLTLNANQTIAPSTVGSLIKTSTVGTGLSYQINSHQTLSFETDVSRTNSSGVTSDFLAGSIVYSYLLTKEWTVQLSYRHLHEFAVSGTSSTGFTVDPITGIPIPLVSGIGPADSNAVTVIVTRSLNVLPDGY
jgi:hypothetical protein